MQKTLAIAASSQVMRPTSIESRNTDLTGIVLNSYALGAFMLPFKIQPIHLRVHGTRSTPRGRGPPATGPRDRGCVRRCVPGAPIRVQCAPGAARRMSSRGRDTTLGDCGLSFPLGYESPPPAPRPGTAARNRGGTTVTDSTPLGCRTQSNYRKTHRRHSHRRPSVSSLATPLHLSHPKPPPRSGSTPCHDM